MTLCWLIQCYLTWGEGVYGHVVNSVVHQWVSYWTKTSLGNTHFNAIQNNVNIHYTPYWNLLWSFDPIETSWWLGTQSRIQKQFAFLDDVLAIDESTDSSQVVVVNGRLLAIVFSSLIYNWEYTSGHLTRVVVSLMKKRPDLKVALSGKKPQLRQACVPGHLNKPRLHIPLPQYSAGI